MVILMIGSACDRAAMEATDPPAAQAHQETSVQRGGANEFGDSLGRLADLANLPVVLDLRLIEEDWDDFRDDPPVAFDFSWEDG
jgi:hypothetical protein